MTKNPLTPRRTPEDLSCKVDSVCAQGLLPPGPCCILMCSSYPICVQSLAGSHHLLNSIQTQMTNTDIVFCLYDNTDVSCPSLLWIANLFSLNGRQNGDFRRLWGRPRRRYFSYIFQLLWTRAIRKRSRSISTGVTCPPPPPPGWGEGGELFNELFSEQQEEKPAFPAEIQPEHLGKTFHIRGNTITCPLKWPLSVLNLEELPPYCPKSKSLLEKCSRDAEKAKQWETFLKNNCLQRGKDGTGEKLFCRMAALKKCKRKEALMRPDYKNCYVEILNTYIQHYKKKP
eukprot:g3371.t1